MADRLAAQNALFDEQYESDLRNYPQRATAFGDYRYNDRLNDYSLDAIMRQHQTDESFLARLEAISTAGFSDQDQLSHDLLIRVLQQRITDFNFKEYEMPINQQSGIHTSLADLPMAVPLDSVKHYEDYIARLHQIPRALSQVTEVLRAGMKDKLMPVRFLAEKIPAQCDGIIAADPFLRPTKRYPASISTEEQKRLTQEITEAINSDVLPAYKNFATFIRTEYAPQGRTTLSITSLPDSEKRYEHDIYARTTTHMTPDEIHQLGLREIDRIEAEMTVIAKKKASRIWPRSALLLRQTPNTSLPRPNRSSTIFGITSRKWSPSFRNCLHCCPNPRLWSRPFRSFRRRQPPTMSPALPMASGRAEL